MTFLGGDTSQNIRVYFLVGHAFKVIKVSLAYTAVYTANDLIILLLNTSEINRR
jgi:hypothetical protein